jgi:hypothetical protein
MGRGLKCSRKKRERILQLVKEGKSYQVIQGELGCSPKLIREVLAFVSPARINFVEQHIGWDSVRWGNVLWSDEAIFVAQNKIAIRVWSCFSAVAGVGPIYWMQRSFNARSYISMLQKHMIPYVDDHMPLTWVFQQDNYKVNSSSTVMHLLKDC